MFNFYVNCVKVDNSPSLAKNFCYFKSKDFSADEITFFILHIQKTCLKFERYRSRLNDEPKIILCFSKTNLSKLKKTHCCMDNKISFKMTATRYLLLCKHLEGVALGAKVMQQ